jgi:hypothetical protein
MTIFEAQVCQKVTADFVMEIEISDVGSGNCRLEIRKT